MSNRKGPAPKDEAERFWPRVDRSGSDKALYGAGGYVQREIADRFGVDRTMVSRIVRGKNWMPCAK